MLGLIKSMFNYFMQRVSDEWYGGKKMRAKYISNAIVLAVLFIMTHQAWAEDWEFRGFLPRGTGLYDKSSIKKINDNIYQVWTATIYNEKGKEDAFTILQRHKKAPDNRNILTHELVLLEFDCANQKYRIASLNIFDEIGSVLLSAPEINDKWRDTVPNSINEKLKNKICAAGKISETDKK